MLETLGIRWFLRGSMIVWLFLMPFSESLAEKKVDSAKENLDEVHRKIEQLKKELDSTQGERKEAADALKASEMAISQAKKKLFDLSKQQQIQEKTLKSLEQETASLESKLDNQQKLLAKQLYQQYVHQQQGVAPLILSQEDPTALARNLKYYGYIHQSRQASIRMMQDNLDEIRQLNDKTASTLASISALKLKQSDEKRLLEREKAEKALIVRALSKKIQTQSKAIDKLKRDEKNLSDLVKKLNRLAAEAKRKKARKPMSPLPKDKGVGVNNQLPDKGAGNLRFSGLKGKLRLPVIGELMNRFGSKREDTGIDWKGLFIRAKEGNEVKSVAPGEVVFADWMRGFGNLIIIDHGDGYMSLYGNNEAILKQVGDRIESGDTIASVGNSGGNPASGLYYELRKNSVPFDPLSWSILK